MEALWSLILFAVFVIIFVWDRLPMATSAILGCVVMVLCGLADFSLAFGQFASSTVILLIAVMVVGAAMAETGVAAAFGNLLTRFSGNNEKVILVIAYVLAALLSSFLTNATVLAIFMPIVVGMSTGDGRINHRNIVLPVLIASGMGGISTLVGSTQQLTANGLLEEVGLGFRVFDFTPVGGLLCVTGLLYCLFIGYPLGKRIWGQRPRDEDCEIAAAETTAIHRRKFYTMIAIIVLMILGYITSIVPPVVTAVTAALLCIMTGCITQKKAVSTLNWNIVGRLGACLGLARVINETGGIELLASWVEGMIGLKLSPFVLFAVAVLITQILSLVMSNSTAILIVLPIVLSLSGSLGLNPTAFAMGIALGSSMGYCCPLSGSSNQMSMAAGYRFRDYFKYAIGLDVISYGVIVLLVPLFFPLTL